MTYDNLNVNYEYCKKILALDFNSIHSIEKLQKYKVILLDSLKYINAYKELGLLRESIEKGFIVQIPELSLDSFVPKDKFMSNNINNALKVIEKVLNDMYRAKLESGVYKGIYYCIMDDCDENMGGYYIELHKVLNEETMEIDFDDRLDYMVIHANDSYEMTNSKKVVEEYIDGLINELNNIKEEMEL